MKFRALIERLSPAFRREDTLCRLITCWLLSSLTLLITSGDLYYSLAYVSVVSFPLLLLTFLLYFVGIGIAKYFLREFPVDPIALFASAVISAVFWLADSSNPFLALAVFAFLAIVALYALHRTEAFLPCIRINRRVFLILVISFAGISASVIAVIGCLRYLTFLAPNYDFGLFCDMFYGMKETGLPLTTSERDTLLSHFAVHISPIYYLILPFFCLFPSPLTLQIAQALIVVAGVIPLLLLARHFKLSRELSLLLAVLYLFYPALASGCFYDIHENCFLPLLLLFTFYFYEKKLYVPMYLSSLLVLAVKEDAAVYLLLFAVYILLSRRSYIHGAILSVLSLSYFSLAIFILNKFGDGAMIGRFDNLIYDKSEGLIGAVKTALANPGFLFTQLFSTASAGWEKILYLLQMLLPLAFLPFFTKKASRLLLVAPILLNLLTAYTYQFDIGFQYHFGILAFFFYAAVMNLPEIATPVRRRVLSLALVACLCIFVSRVFPNCGYYVDTYAATKDDCAAIEETLQLIPKDASVSASGYFVAHIADRAAVYEIAYHASKTDIDYVAIDLRHDSSADRTTRYYKAKGYKVFAELDGLVRILVSPDA